MSELDEIMNGKQEMRGFRIEGDTIGFDTQKHANWNLSPRDIENIIYTLQQELDQYKNNWEELKKMFEADEHFEDGCYCSEILNKMKELEDNN